MSDHGVPPSENLARVAALADKAAGYPSEAVFLGSRLPSGVFTLRLAARTMPPRANPQAAIRGKR